MISDHPERDYEHRTYWRGGKDDPALSSFTTDRYRLTKPVGELKVSNKHITPDTDTMTDAEKATYETRRKQQSEARRLRRLAQRIREDAVNPKTKHADYSFGQPKRYCHGCREVLPAGCSYRRRYCDKCRKVHQQIAGRKGGAKYRAKNRELLNQRMQWWREDLKRRQAEKNGEVSE